MANLFFLGGKLPKIESKIKLQFRDYTIITVEPDQENSVSIMKPPLYAWGGKCEVWELVLGCAGLKGSCGCT